MSVSEIDALRMMELLIPQHVIRGQSVKLECNFNLDNVNLYSVKWYKDGNEFYRYVPREKPPVLVFPLPGVTVDVSTPLLIPISESKGGEMRRRYKGRNCLKART